MCVLGDHFALVMCVLGDHFALVPRGLFTNLQCHHMALAACMSR